MPGQEQQSLPEGLRSRDVRKVFTETEIRTASQAAGTVADLITYDGVTWQVMVVEPWPTPSVLPHYEATVVRVVEATS